METYALESNRTVAGNSLRGVAAPELLGLWASAVSSVTNSGSGGNSKRRSRNTALFEVSLNSMLKVSLE
jgi:hypothetical protein